MQSRRFLYADYAVCIGPRSWKGPGQTRTNTKWNVKFNIQERSADIDTRSYTHHFYFGSFNQGTNNQDSKKEKD
uniref:Uncharacterized protein n=1 Tax=Knipowitschia caucasica TaxID=637954 RepID=A0AAV2K5B2_KNICA